MKKILTLIAALSLVASLAVGGSIAYLQDTDADVNVMTMGSVYIKQHEKDENGKDFQNQPLYPGQTIHKHVTVENTGKSDAYVRTFIALENDENGIIEVVKNTATDWTWNDTTYPITVNGTKFNVYEAVYNHVLTPGSTTPDSLQTIAMKAIADNDDVSAFGDEYEVLALSQAVQTVGFDGADAAFTASFQEGKELTAEMVGGWFNAEVEYPTNVEISDGQTLNDVLAAAEEGADLYITLTSDINYVTAGSSGVQDITKAASVTIDGANKYKIIATGSGVSPIGDPEATLTLKNLTVEDNSVSYAEDAWEFSYLEIGGANLICENVVFADPIMVDGENASFVNCNFNGYKEEGTKNGSAYSIELNGVWMYSGDATFNNCTFTGIRGMKICDMYAGEVGTVVIDGCTFSNITNKPGVAIDDEDTQDMKITIKNSTFINCQPGDQKLYIYETDNTVPTLADNTVKNDVTVQAVGSYDDLAALFNNVSDGIINLTQDIDLGGQTVAALGSKYGGSLTFNGNGHKIYNGSLNAGTHNGMDNYGLFYAYTNTSLTINDLTIENVNIDTTNDTDRNYGAAIVVGYADGGSTVTLNNVDVKNCSVKNTSDEAAVYVGYTNGTVNMTNCNSTGCSVQGETAEKTGAFIGHLNGGTATISNCTTDLSIGLCNRNDGKIIEK